jgi:hypothetical protein
MNISKVPADASGAPEQNVVQCQVRAFASQSPSMVETVLEDWIAIINQTYATAVADIIKTGQCLIRAKIELGHGHLGLLFRADRLRFSQRRAEVFMEIAKCPVLADPQHSANLPSAWSVLHILSQMPVLELMQALASGSVHPGMTLRQARHLAQKNNAPNRSVQSTPCKFNSERRLGRLADYLWREVMLWPPDRLPELAESLNGIAEDIAKGHYAKAPQCV